MFGEEVKKKSMFNFRDICFNHESLGERKGSSTPQHINGNLIQKNRIQRCTECKEEAMPKETGKLLRGRKKYGGRKAKERMYFEKQ